MRKILTVGLLLLLVASSGSAGAVMRPYVYRPTVPDTAFAVIALYKVGDYSGVLEGCEWLMAIKTPFDSWGYAYGEDNEAKYTAMAIMALVRGESIARGRYFDTINSAAYWLIYKQNPDGSWKDYTDTALAYLALREFLKSKYVNDKLPGFREQLTEATKRARAWLEMHEPRTDEERIWGYLALGDVKKLEALHPKGDLVAYRAFALAYLGRKTRLSGDFRLPRAVAMALYATGSDKYREELLKMEHFGFWGVLHFRTLDLLNVAMIKGFMDLKSAACPYVGLIKASSDWQRVALAKYYVMCGLKPQLPENYSSLLPWQVAEIARIDALLGMNYSAPVAYLLSRSEEGIWRDFYNTEYVVWVFRRLNVTYNYSVSLRYLERNLTWMATTKDAKTGNPVYYNVPTYYFAYAVIVFKEFGMTKALNETLSLLRERQYPNGAFPYTEGSLAGITSTSTVAWALQESGLNGSDIYSKATSFLRSVLYADIPSLQPLGKTVRLDNATFLLVKDSKYVGNQTDQVFTDGLDGYIVVYPRESPLSVSAIAVKGFHAASPWREHGITRTQVLVVLLLAAAIGGVWYYLRRMEKRRIVGKKKKLLKKVTEE